MTHHKFFIPVLLLSEAILAVGSFVLGTHGSEVIIGNDFKYLSYIISFGILIIINAPLYLISVISNTRYIMACAFISAIGLLSNAWLISTSNIESNYQDKAVAAQAKLDAEYKQAIENRQAVIDSNKAKIDLINEDINTLKVSLNTLTQSLASQPKVKLTNNKKKNEAIDRANLALQQQSLSSQDELRKSIYDLNNKISEKSKELANLTPDLPVRKLASISKTEFTFTSYLMAFIIDLLAVILWIIIKIYNMSCVIYFNENIQDHGEDAILNNHDDDEELISKPLILITDNDKLDFSISDIDLDILGHSDTVSDTVSDISELSTEVNNLVKLSETTCPKEQILTNSGEIEKNATETTENDVMDTYLSVSDKDGHDANIVDNLPVLTYQQLKDDVKDKVFPLDDDAMLSISSIINYYINDQRFSVPSYRTFQRWIGSLINTSLLVKNSKYYSYPNQVTPTEAKKQARKTSIGGG